MRGDIQKIIAPTIKAFKIGRDRGLIVPCPACNIDHYHADGVDCFGGVYAPQCFDGPGSPYARTGYRLEIEHVAGLRDLSDPFAAFANHRLWSHLQANSARLLTVTAGIILQRRRPLSVFDGKLTRVGATRFRLAGRLWTYGPHRGEDLATAAARLYRTTPGTAAVRIAEAALGLHLDAQAFIEVQRAIDGFFLRGACRGESRRA